MLRLAAAGLTAVLCAWGAGAGSAAARGLELSPFAGDHGAKQAAGVSLDPFRIALADADGDAHVDAKTEAAAAAVAPAPAAAPAPVKAAAPAPAAKSCSRDEECPAENICQGGTCQAIQRRTNILYLYYREGSFREVLGLFWSKSEGSGSAGYHVLVPIYWHFWTPQDRSRVVAPFFWRFEDFAARRTSTVIVPGLPISWSSQPDASSFGVWPLFYHSTKFGWAAPLLGSFTIADPDHRHWWGSLLYLYWWKRSPEHSVDVAFPLLISTRTPASAFTYAVPLNFYWRGKDDRNLLALPIMYWNQHKNGGSLYALTGYRTHEKGVVDGSLFWLYWFGTDDTDKSAYDVLFPLLWSFRSPKSSTTVAVPFLYARRGGWSFATVFPLWYSGGDQDQGSKFHTLLPFFYSQTTEHGKKELLLLPIGGYSRDDIEGSRTLLLFPVLFTRQDREGTFHALTPIYLRAWDRHADATTQLISLLLYRRDDPQGTSTVLFPLFWRFRDSTNGASATALLPFFAHRSGPHDQSTFAGVFPLWFYKRSFSDGGWSGGLFPLAFFGQRGESGHAVVFPLVWHFRQAEKSTTLAVPLFYTSSNRHGSDSGILPLLTFFGHRDGEKYAIQFPLFWRFSSQREGWTTTVTPVGFYHTDRDGWSAGAGPLLPLLYAGGGPGTSHFALLPLFWHFRDDAQQRSTTVVLTYLHRSLGGETTDALFPLFHYRRGARPGGSDETSFTLFPIVHYRRDATSRLVLTPLGGAKKTADSDVGLVGPYFWCRKPTFTATGLVPVYLDVTDKTTQERTRQLGLWFQIDAPGRQSRILFPLFGRYDDAFEHDTYVFPTFFRQRKTDGYQLDTFFPLFWSSRYQGRTTKLVGLWYERSGPGVTDTGLVPLYFYAKNAERSILVIPPLLVYRRADFKAGTETLFALLSYHTHDLDSSKTVVFPLWWSGHEKAHGHQVLFPVYWHFMDGDQKTELHIAGPFFWSTNGSSHTRGLLPIAWYSRNPKTGEGSNAFLPLFYEAGGPNRFTLLTLLAGYSKRETSRTWYVGPVAASDGVETRFRMAFPLWFSHTNKGTEATTQVIPPLLHVSRSTPETNFSTWLALYWSYHTIASATTVVLPLYFDVHDLHQSRVTVLFPLLLRSRNDAEDSTTWVAPLFYRHSAGADSTTVAFPLVWAFKHGDQDQTTVVFPFYASWRRPTYASTYVFPTYYYREGWGPKGPDGTWDRLIFPLFESAVRRPGDYMWEVLGGLFGHERIGRNEYLKLLFMTFETKAPTHVQTAWYSSSVRVPRRKPPRGLNTNVW